MVFRFVPAVAPSKSANSDALVLPTVVPQGSCSTSANDRGKALSVHATQSTITAPSSAESSPPAQAQPRRQQHDALNGFLSGSTAGSASTTSRAQTKAVAARKIARRSERSTSPQSTVDLLPPASSSSERQSSTSQNGDIIDTSATLGTTVSMSPRQSATHPVASDKTQRSVAVRRSPSTKALDVALSDVPSPPPPRALLTPPLQPKPSSSAKAAVRRQSSTAVGLLPSASCSTTSNGTAPTALEKVRNELYAWNAHLRAEAQAKQLDGLMDGV